MTCTIQPWPQNKAIFHYGARQCVIKTLFQPKLVFCLSDATACMTEEHFQISAIVTLSHKISRKSHFGVFCDVYSFENCSFCLLYWYLNEDCSNGIILWGAGLVQWLERRTRDRNVARSNPCRSGGGFFLSGVNFLCWLLFLYPFYPVLPQ